MTRTMMTFCFAALAAACVSTQEEPAGPVRVHAQPPREVRAALIRAMPMQPGAIKNVKGMNDAPALFASGLRATLASRHPDWRIAVGDANSGVGDADLVVEAELLEIEGGSAAMRFWVGFGAGAIVSRVKVTLRDRTAKVLAATDIVQRTTCPLGACGEENEPMVRDNLKALAENTAAFVSNPAEYEKTRTATQ